MIHNTMNNPLAQIYTNSNMNNMLLSYPSSVIMKPYFQVFKHIPK